MPAERVPRHGFVPDREPSNPPDDGVQVLSEQWSKPEYVWKPPKNDRNVLQGVRTDLYSESTAVIVDGRYAPGY